MIWFHPLGRLQLEKRLEKVDLDNAHNVTLAKDNGKPLLIFMMYIYIYIYTYVYMYVYMYTHIYIPTHIYIHLQVYTHHICMYVYDNIGILYFHLMDMFYCQVWVAYGDCTHVQMLRFFGWLLMHTCVLTTDPNDGFLVFNGNLIVNKSG